MPSLAKAYIATIAAVAAVILTVVASRWNPESVGRFLLFFALAMLASAMKIRLPGFKTTISINFVFVLISIALFSFSETVLIGLGGARCDEHRAGIVDHLLSGGTPPQRDLVLLL